MLEIPTHLKSELCGGCVYADRVAGCHHWSRDLYGDRMVEDGGVHYAIAYILWPELLAISTTGIFFAPMGARLVTVVPTLIRQRVFAFCVLIVGVKVLF